MPKNSNINIHTLNVNDIEQQLLSLSPATPQQMETALKVVEQIKSRKAALHLMQICIKQVEAMQANASEWAGLYYECLKLAARYGDFECFMLYVEKDRPADAKFYEPRRKSIHTIVEGLQALLDDELDELFISMPARVGKSGTCKMFEAFVAGLYPERTNLYASYSDTASRTMYTGVLEILTDEFTYKYKDVFPNITIAATNADKTTIDINRKKTYPTLTYRSIGGSMNGSCDCNFIWMADDLIEGIEEAKSVERCKAKWDLVSNNFYPRGVGGDVKRVWIGTRWSVNDPISFRLDTLENQPEFENIRYKVINIPALDENDESNFDYPFKKGFSTEEYRRIRASFERRDDMASWMAQYGGEPIERQGAVFTSSVMRYYNGVLPEGDPDRIIMFCDPAFGGGDYVSAPVGYQYGDDIYIHDVVYDNRDKSITRPRVVALIERNNVSAGRFEADKGGMEYAEWVDTELRKRGRRVNIQSKYAPNTMGKVDRIVAAAPDIKERCVFLDGKHRNPEYSKFMDGIFSFVIAGNHKRAHDDAPDSMAGLIVMVDRPLPKARVIKNPFVR